MEVEEDSSCDELEYSVTRLVKGLASSRKGARQGFATVLTEVLSEFASLSPEGMLRLITKTLEVTGSSKAWVSTKHVKTIQLYTEYLLYMQIPSFPCVNN